MPKIDIKILILLVTVIVVGLFLAWFFLPGFSSGIRQQKTGQQDLSGLPRDAHGCLIGADISWCEAKQKCIRIWEESCQTK